MEINNNKEFKILLVDDEPELLQIIERILRNENYKVSTAINGHECIEAIRRDKPDLILLDVMLPDLNGIEICKKIRNDSETASIFIILISGSKIDSDTVSEGLETGADGYLIKPLKNREILARVEAAKRIIHAEKALRKSEEKYHFMFDNNPQPMLIYDLETLSILEVNQTAINHYGYSRDEFLSMTLKDIRPIEDLPALIKDIERVKCGENKVGEWKHIKKNGEIILVEITAQSIIYNELDARQVLIFDITERKHAEEELKKSQEQLKKFTNHLLNIEEEEKLLLATQLDNELSQILVALKMDIGMLKKKVLSENINTETEELFFKLDQAYNIVGSSIQASMKFMSDLRNEVLYLVGFVEAVKLYSAEFQERSNIKCCVNTIIQELEINKQQETSLFRIFQHAMSNVAQHSKASRVRINLYKSEEKLILEIWDNGIGFDQKKLTNPDFFGLIYMKERAALLNGCLQIESLLNQGTSVRVVIPYFN